MTTWQSSTIAVDGLRLHYTRTGGAKPPLVLAHGFSDDGLCWSSVATALEPDYDVIMVDARGHGRSDAPEHGYGAYEHARDLASLIAALELSRPVVLGHSMGAVTALTLAGAYPNLVGALLLEDPPPWWEALPPAAPANAERQEQRRTWLINLKRQTREELIAAQRIATPDWADDVLGPWADSKLRLSLNVLNGSGVAPTDWPATLQQISCPVLLITADPARGALVSAENAASLAALVPQLRVAHIPNAGHCIRYAQFAGYMDAVRAFLDETSGEG